MDREVRQISRREALTALGVAGGVALGSAAIDPVTVAQAQIPPAEAGISGTVEFEDGSPAVGVTVYAIPHDDTQDALETTTDGNGAYEFPQAALYPTDNLYHVITRYADGDDIYAAAQNYPFVNATGPEIVGIEEFYVGFIDNTADIAYVWEGIALDDVDSENISNYVPTPVFTPGSLFAYRSGSDVVDKYDLPPIGSTVATYTGLASENGLRFAGDNTRFLAGGTDTGGDGSDEAHLALLDENLTELDTIVRTNWQFTDMYPKGLRAGVMAVNHYEHDTPQDELADRTEFYDISGDTLSLVDTDTGFDPSQCVLFYDNDSGMAVGNGSTLREYQVDPFAHIDTHTFAWGQNDGAELDENTILTAGGNTVGIIDVSDFSVIDSMTISDFTAIHNIDWVDNALVVAGSNEANDAIRIALYEAIPIDGFGDLTNAREVVTGTSVNGVGIWPQ